MELTIRLKAPVFEIVVIEQNWVKKLNVNRFTQTTMI